VALASLLSRLQRRFGRDAIEYTGSEIGRAVLACPRCGALVDALQEAEKKPYTMICSRCAIKEQGCQETT
jgi:hypothetical protein